MLRALVSSTFCSVGIFLCLIAIGVTSIPHLPLDQHELETRTDSPNNDSEWSSPYASWHSRALLTPHPNPHNFTPTLDTLLLSMRYMAMIGEGFTLALFSGSVPGDSNTGTTSIAVDSVGRVLLVSQNDTNGILSLAQEALTMPPGDSWSIDRGVTCLPSDLLFIPYIPSPSAPNATSYQGAKLAGLHPRPDSPRPVRDPGTMQHPFRRRGHEQRVIRIHGFSKLGRALEHPVEGVAELPRVLWELFGLGLEGSNGWMDVKKDEVVLNRVFEVIGRNMFD